MNFELTYLQPLKLKQANEMVQKPQAKTIKSGRLVKLPIVVRNKEMARTGMNCMPMGHRNRAYSTVNHERRFETAVPKETHADDTAES